MPRGRVTIRALIHLGCACRRRLDRRSAVIGIEPDRVDDISRWASAIVLALRADALSFLDEIETAQAELDEYVDGLIAPGVMRRRVAT